MVHEGFTIFSLKISCAQFDVYCVRGVSLIKFTHFDSCLVLFDSDILRKTFYLIFIYFLVLVFHFDFSAYL